MNTVIACLRLLSVTFVLFASLLEAATVEYGPVQRDHIEVELIAEHDSARPGEPLRVGLRLLPDPGWHTYWKNPGDSGLPTLLHWDLPDGMVAGKINWPYPERLPVAHMVNYGYEGEHLLPVTLDVPQELVPGTELELVVSAEWLVCEVVCIPGDATLGIKVPVSADPPAAVPTWSGLFAWADKRRPQAVEWPARFSTESGQLSARVRLDESVTSADWQFFTAAENLVDHPAEAFITQDNGWLQLAMPLSPFFVGAPERLELVLVDTSGGRAYSVLAEPGELGTMDDAVPTEPALLLILLMALVGGVLLNLMPCVFPVLSIKALSVVSGAGHERAHGLAYTAGVVASFALLAAILLGLRAGGEAIGWGFQLQSPWFVGILAYLLFALGLALSGVFEPGARLMGVGQQLTTAGGLRGSFFTGVLACVVASPCTAPLMGTALGVAVLLPWPQAMGVFLALGLGLALPMLVISFSPTLARLLPKPGPWMETFKQAMAFPLYLAVVWLLWVLARQTDANGVAAVLAGMVVLAFALWLTGRPDRNGWMAPVRHVAIVASLVFAVAALGAAVRMESETAAPVQAGWEPYTAERLAALRVDPDRAVLVNMTADWCVTCLVNERVALNTEAVRQAMADHDVVYLKGDWTRRDPKITEYLAEFGRNGVPLYVLYPHNGDEPRVLPQVLTPGLVVQAMERLQ